MPDDRRSRPPKRTRATESAAAADRRAQFRLLRGGRADAPHPPIDLTPASTYEALTRQMVEALAEELGEIKGRLDGLLWMIAGAVIIDVALRVAGLD